MRSAAHRIRRDFQSVRPLVTFRSDEGLVIVFEILMAYAMAIDDLERTTCPACDSSDSILSIYRCAQCRGQK